MYYIHDLYKKCELLEVTRRVNRTLESLHAILHSGGRELMLLITVHERRGRHRSGLSSSLGCIENNKPLL